MKIIHISDNLGKGGGVNSFVYDICYEQKNSGLDVYLVGILGRKENHDQIKKLEACGVKVFCIEAQSKKQAILKCRTALKQLIIKISDGSFTICNLHLKLSVLMGAICSLGVKNVYCVETYHNTYKNYHLQHWLLRPVIKKYICVSDTAMKEMHRRFFTPYKKLIAAPNGVNRMALRNSVGSKQKGEHNSFALITVGRFSYEKNVHTSVKAMADICNDSLVYEVVGDGPDRELVRLSANSNPNIHFSGSVSRKEVLEKLYSADVLIMPSLWEGRSILMLEAMAFDLPMIISNAPGLLEVFDEAGLREDELFRICKFGAIVQTMNPMSYIEAVQCLIKDKEQLNNMRQYVKSVSLKNDISIMLEKYQSVYDSVESKYYRRIRNVK